MIRRSSDTPQSNRRNRRAFFMSEMGIGLAIVAAVAGALVVVIARQQRGSQQLADHRAAIRLAETTIENLRIAQPIAPPADTTVEPLNDPSPLPDRKWVAVHATVNGRSVVLTGLVPQAAAASAATRPTTREAR